MLVASMSTIICLRLGLFHDIPLPDDLTTKYIVSLSQGCEYLKDADSAQKFFNRMEKARSTNTPVAECTSFKIFEDSYTSLYTPVYSVYSI